MYQTLQLRTGKEINIQSSRNSDAQSLVSQIRLLVPDMTITTQQPVASNPQPTHAGVTDAERTLSQINPDNIKPLDIATALNLEVIHFASGSAQVPDVNKPILDQAAALLQRVPNVVVTVKATPMLKAVKLLITICLYSVPGL